MEGLLEYNLHYLNQSRNATRVTILEFHGHDFDLRENTMFSEERNCNRIEYRVHLPSIISLEYFDSIAQHVLQLQKSGEDFFCSAIPSLAWFLFRLVQYIKGKYGIVITIHVLNPEEIDQFSSQIIPEYHLLSDINWHILLTNTDRTSATVYLQCELLGSVHYMEKRPRGLMDLKNCEPTKALPTLLFVTGSLFKELDDELLSCYYVIAIDYYYTITPEQLELCHRVYQKRRGHHERFVICGQDYGGYKALRLAQALHKQFDMKMEVKLVNPLEDYGDLDANLKMPDWEVHYDSHSTKEDLYKSMVTLVKHNKKIDVNKILNPTKDQVSNTEDIIDPHKPTVFNLRINGVSNGCDYHEHNVVHVDILKTKLDADVSTSAKTAYLNSIVKYLYDRVQSRDTIYGEGLAGFLAICFAQVLYNDKFFYVTAKDPMDPLNPFVLRLSNSIKLNSNSGFDRWNVLFTQNTPYLSVICAYDTVAKVSVVYNNLMQWFSSTDTVVKTIRINVDNYQFPRVDDNTTRDIFISSPNRRHVLEDFCRIYNPIQTDTVTLLGHPASCIYIGQFMKKYFGVSTIGINVSITYGETLAITFPTDISNKAMWHVELSELCTDQRFNSIATVTHRMGTKYCK